jgi:hypothetical protein
MKTAIELSIPVEVEMSTGSNWLEAHWFGLGDKETGRQGESEKWKMKSEKWKVEMKSDD